MARKHHPKHKKDRTGLYMGLFIAFIMVTSAFGVVFYGYSESDNTSRYKGHKFKLTSMGYEAKIDGNRYFFEALPQDVEHLNITHETKNTILNSSAVIVTTQLDSAYTQEIALAQYNLNQIISGLGKQVANAFTEDTDTLPAITCMNATADISVIEIIEADSANVEVQENCIRIKFDTAYNLKVYTSYIIYQLLGVIDG
jgi:hypothetical protein